MSDQPIILEEHPDYKIKMEVGQQTTTEQKFVDEVKIGDKTIFTIPLTMQFEQNNLVPKQRKTRWGQLVIRKQKIQQDVVFNPLEALVSGSSLLPITQYGQSELELKMSIFGDPNSRRKSKWHHDIQKTFTPPMMNYISGQISLDQIQYLLRLARLDQLKSKMADFIPDDPDVRSPSPQPIYDRTGKRLNTREVRKRDQMIKQRIILIEDCMKMRKSFKPPVDYKPLKKYKKVYLNDTAMNDTQANYMGRIIGHAGSTQKLIEQRSGCKIAIRGRGANNIHKDIYENFQRLHVLITADTEEQLQKGVQEIQKILNGQEDPQLKAAQQRQLMLMQGIFTQNFCDNCHQQGHRTWACPHDVTHTRNMIKCSICHEISHPTSDCPQKAQYVKAQQTIQQNILLESQYSKFKSEMTEKQKPREGGLAFITDVSKKDLLAIQNKKQVPIIPNTNNIILPPLGSFPMPIGLTNKIGGIPNFENNSTTMNFPIPKFESNQKK